MSDLPGYTDLTLYDVTETELVDRALTDATIKLPDWRPQAGNTEVVLIESLALIVAELVYAINRVPERALEALLVLYGLYRSPGTPCQGLIVFTPGDLLAHVVPAGTTLRVVVPTTSEEVTLTLNEDLTIPAGGTPASGAVTATEVGVAGNGLPAGTVAELIDAVPFIDAVAVGAGGLAGGTEAEDDTGFYTRGAALLQRLVSTLVLPDHFTAAGLAEADVARARTVDLYNPDAGSGSPGSHAGHVTVAVRGPGGNLSSTRRSQLAAKWAGQAIAGLGVHVIDPTVTPVNVTVQVVPAAGYTASQAVADVTAALTAYLTPAAWGWGSTVWRNELIALVSNVASVDRVAAMPTPTGDVALTGVAPLATVGTLIVTTTS